jgi:hypothetical protein
MRFRVGGEDYDLSKERVERTMRDAAPEPIQKHVVEVEGRSYPPKQVFAAVTGRQRTSFTTMEAQRVLRRLGFVCREAGRGGASPPEAVVPDRGGQDGGDIIARGSALESIVGTVQAAIVGLHARVANLERRV